jgi:hypothetical protein
MLCRKAGVPAADARGSITSHRARSTIAGQLYNAKEPLTLFELQAWLGHRSPECTQHYAKISPNTLTKAYDDAGYFARNIRTIEVPFFEQCPHRMACARCGFYTHKESGEAQLLEAKGNLQRMRAAIPLTDGNQRVRGF